MKRGITIFTEILMSDDVQSNMTELSGPQTNHVHKLPFHVFGQWEETRKTQRKLTQTCTFAQTVA